MAVPSPSLFGYEAVIEPSGVAAGERFVLLNRYSSDVPSGDGTIRLHIELLVDPDSEAFWASIPEVGVAATGKTPAEAAVSAIRAATALL